MFTCKESIGNFVYFAGDKPAAMKHSNQSETADNKSAAATTMQNFMYSVLSLLLGVYSLRALDS